MRDEFQAAVGRTFESSSEILTQNSPLIRYSLMTLGESR